MLLIVFTETYAIGGDINIYVYARHTCLTQTYTSQENAF